MAIRTHTDRSDDVARISETKKQGSLERKSAERTASSPASSRTEEDQVSISRSNTSSRAQSSPKESKLDKLTDYPEASALAEKIRSERDSTSPTLLSAHGELDSERVRILLEGIEE